MPEDPVRAAIEDIEFPSADGSSTIHARIWRPAAVGAGARLKAIVQVVHGMSEHIHRYDEFARYLCGQGYVVCGDDHIGHGASTEPGRRGCLPAHGGAEALIADEHTLRGIVSAKFDPETPYVLFGHSLGSFIVRCYLSRHGEGLAGAVICGTGTVPVAVSRAGHALALAIAAARGEDYRSKLLDSMGAGGYAKAVPGPTGFEWLSYNEDNVRAYVADEECGFMFSAGGYAALTALTAEACSRACAAAAPHDLPLLYISGDGDPVGDMGLGVQAAAELARGAGSLDVTCKVYEHMRHEILQEGGRAEVFADVASWIGEKAGAGGRSAEPAGADAWR